MKPIVGHLYNTNKGIKVAIFDEDWTVIFDNYRYKGVSIGGDRREEEYYWFNIRGNSVPVFSPKLKLIEDLTDKLL